MSTPPVSNPPINTSNAKRSSNEICKPPVKRGNSKTDNIAPQVLEKNQLGEVKPIVGIKVSKISETMNSEGSSDSNEVTIPEQVSQLFERFEAQKFGPLQKPTEKELSNKGADSEEKIFKDLAEHLKQIQDFKRSILNKCKDPKNLSEAKEALRNAIVTETHLNQLLLNMSGDDSTKLIVKSSSKDKDNIYLFANAQIDPMHADLFKAINEQLLKELLMDTSCFSKKNKIIFKKLNIETAFLKKGLFSSSINENKIKHEQLAEYVSYLNRYRDYLNKLAELCYHNDEKNTRTGEIHPFFMEQYGKIRKSIVDHNAGSLNSKIDMQTALKVIHSGLQVYFLILDKKIDRFGKKFVDNPDSNSKRKNFYKSDSQRAEIVKYFDAPKPSLALLGDYGRVVTSNGLSYKRIAIENGEYVEKSALLSLPEYLKMHPEFLAIKDPDEMQQKLVKAWVNEVIFSGTSTFYWNEPLVFQIFSESVFQVYKEELEKLKDKKTVIPNENDLLGVSLFNFNFLSSLDGKNEVERKRMVRLLAAIETRMKKTKEMQAVFERGHTVAEFADILKTYYTMPGQWASYDAVARLEACAIALYGREGAPIKKISHVDLQDIPSNFARRIEMTIIDTPWNTPWSASQNIPLKDQTSFDKCTSFDFLTRHYLGNRKDCYVIYDVKMTRSSFLGSLPGKGDEKKRCELSCIVEIPESLSERDEREVQDYVRKLEKLLEYCSYKKSTIPSADDNSARESILKVKKISSKT